MASPKDLREFCVIGTPRPPNSNDWLYKVWGKAWIEGDIGITSRPVVRDESAISLDPPLPSSCWVMQKFEQHEFTPFWVSDVYVRDSFVPLARLIIALRSCKFHGNGDLHKPLHWVQGSMAKCCYSIGILRKWYDHCCLCSSV